MSSRRWPLPFFKYSGAGNDFILLDGRDEEPAGDPSALAKALCQRGRSVGADGLIVVEGPGPDAGEGALARMRLWNADGSHAEISGNGARCVARFLVDRGAAPDSVRFATDIGLVSAQVDGDICRLTLPVAATVHPGCRLRVEGRDLSGTYVDIGVPFFVCFHDNPDELAVRFLGRAIRNHADLAPRGANVDFVRVEDEQRLFFRVYERGVEDETLSSGTGSISAALAAAAAGNVASPVVCVARGAELTVRFRRDDAETPEARPDTPVPNAGTAAAGAETPTAGVDGTTADEDAATAEASVVTDDGASEGNELPAVLSKASSESGIRFVDLEIEGDAMPIYDGEAHTQASRAPRRA